MAIVFPTLFLLLLALATIGFSKETCPDESWIGPSAGFCYLLTSESNNHDGHSNACRALGDGVDLVSIVDKAENDFIKDRVLPKNVDAILGLKKDRSWKWDDGTPWDFKNWATPGTI